MEFQPLVAHPTNTSLAPSYTTLPRRQENDHGSEIELLPWAPGRNDDASVLSSSDGAAPPLYAHSTAAFAPQVRLQIQTGGKPLLSLPLPVRPDPIPVFATDEHGATTSTAVFVSVRHSRSSGTSCLVAGGGGDTPGLAALSDTTYRFGPGRPPRVRLWLPGTGPSVASLAEAVRTSGALTKDRTSSSTASSSADPTLYEGGAMDEWDSFEVQCQGVFTRTCRFRTRLGTFEWRYAPRRERPPGVNSLLVLDRVVRVFRSRTSRNEGSPSGSLFGGKRGDGDDEMRTQVARLVRSDEFRSPGSGPSTAGNGGRLLVDLACWAEEDKGEREMALVMVVTTAVCMLKKEVDRRRAHQAAIMGGAAGS